MNSLSRPWLTMMRLFPSSLAALILIVRNVWAGPVEVMRTPDNGIQPQAMVGADGRVHLLYFKGDAAGGDLFYTYRKAQSEGWVAPMRVNRLSGSGLAIGSVRGAQLALGRNGWVHVAWMGSSKAQSVRLGARDQSPSCMRGCDQMLLSLNLNRICSRWQEDWMGADRWQPMPWGMSRWFGMV